MNSVSYRQSTTFEHPTIGLEIGAASKARGDQFTNCDAYFANQEHAVIGIFDGLGESKGAARVADVAANYALRRTVSVPSELSPMQAQTAMRSILEGMYHAVQDVKQQEALDPKVATTAVIAKLCIDRYRQLYIVGAYAGDSRAYHHEYGSMHQLTLDHSEHFMDYYPEDRWKRQRVFADVKQIEDFPTGDLESDFKRRNIVGSAVGRAEEPYVDTFAHRIRGDSSILMTTDGVHDNLTDHEICEIIDEPDATSDQLAETIVASAGRVSSSSELRAKPDDITAVVLSIHSRPFKK